MIQRDPQRQAPLPADRAVGWLQTHHPAKRRRQPNRPSGVRPARRENHPRRDRRRRPPTRPSGNPLQIPRIAHRSKMWIGRCDPVAQLMQIGLAQRDRTRRSQLSHDLSVVIGHPVRQDLRSARRPHSLGREAVLVCDGNAAQDSVIRCAGEFLKRLCNGEERVQPGVKTLDAIQRFPRQLLRADFAFSERPPGCQQRTVQ